MRNRLPQVEKKRNQDRNETEHLKGIIRELEKQVRQLKQELRYYKKRPEKEQETLELETKESRIPCDDCGKGFYDEFLLLDKVYGTCDTCDSRKRLK